MILLPELLLLLVTPVVVLNSEMPMLETEAWLPIPVARTLQLLTSRLMLLPVLLVALPVWLLLNRAIPALETALPPLPVALASHISIWIAMLLPAMLLLEPP